MKKKKSLLVKVAMTLLFAVLSSAGAWASEVVTAYQKNRPSDTLCQYESPLD